MKMMKKIIALALVSLMALSFAACHEKDEIAVKVGDLEFTSAYYMCALINADMDAQGKAQESLTDKEKKDPKFDIYSKKIDGMDYVEWVEKQAIENIKRNAAYKMLCAKNKVEPTAEQSASAKQYAEFYWANYGYAGLFEPNGVSKNTFVKYMTDTNCSSLYFDHLYAKEGVKAISDEEMKKTMAENFVLADSISTSFTDDQGKPMTDDKIKELKDKFNGYVTALKDGSKTYETVYHEFNGTKESDDTKEEDKKDENNKEDKEELKPINRHARVLGSKDTAYSSDDFDKVKGMAVNEVKLVELEKNGGLTIFVKRDLEADPYYVDQIDSAVRHFLKDDEFKKEIDDFVKGLKVEVVERAVKPFKVKKIEYPQTGY